MALTDYLKTARSVDLAKVELNYERFRELSQNPHISSNERIGFPDDYRRGFESAIFYDICRKLPALQGRQKVIVDIGPGCAVLPHMIIDLCERNEHRLILVDSREMLDQLPDSHCVVKVPGPYPKNAVEVKAAAHGPVDALLCYSVLHYLYVDTNLFDVVDFVVDLMGAGGDALFGDIPNVSKRKRFFSSPTGVSFHQRFAKTEEIPQVEFNRPEPGRIDDAVLAGLIQRAQSAGCDAYLLPQSSDLPMANRRDDLLIKRP